MSGFLIGQTRRGRRRQAREMALAYLFQYDFDLKPTTQDLVRFFFHFEAPVEIREFAQALIEGALTHRTDLDAAIEEASDNWKIYRMDAIDRNILRLGAFELKLEPGTDMPVIIDEAVELAQRFGGTQSASFVNGILDRLAAKWRPEAVKSSVKASSSNEGSSFTELAKGEERTLAADA